LVKAHLETKAAMDKGAADDELAGVRTLIRHAQWRWDFAAAGHGNAFHAPLETARILGTSIDKAQEARVRLAKILARHGMTGDVALPDTGTKAKAQKHIGLDMKKLAAEKSAAAR